MMSIAIFKHFNLDKPVLTKAYSSDEKAVEVVRSKVWDCIYIDGSHDYEIAKNDWELCSKHVKIGGLIVMDDSELNTKYNPPFFAFGGHPGPSIVAAEIDKNFYKEILQTGHNRVFQRIA